MAEPRDSSVTARGPRANRRMVLIHGAWQGSWAFDAWLPELARHGWQATAIDLPGNGWGPQGNAQEVSLDHYAAHVAERLRALDEPAVLVGHSGGGITAAQVAEMLPQHVACLVYLAGMMLPSETGFADIVAMCQQEQPSEDFRGIAPWLDTSADGRTTTVRHAGALQVFLHDCDPAAADKAARLLRPQRESGRKMRPRLSAERYGTVRRVYVECTDDRSVLLPLQRKMQALSPGADRLTLHCGHVPQLAQPAALAQLLCTHLDTILA